MVSLSFAWEGKVVNAADGDTVTVLNNQNQTTKVRLYGVDTPEKSQAFGQKAKQFTLSLVGGKTVDVEGIDIDRYGRTVGLVNLGNTSLNVELLKAGMAWYYGQYCKKGFCGDWKQMEQNARSNKTGLWSDPHVQAPWDFRHGEKQPESKSEIDAAGTYHGNVSSHKFHKPGCKYYDCKDCTAAFQNRDAAIAAGYQPCGVCKP